MIDLLRFASYMIWSSLSWSWNALQQFTITFRIEVIECGGVYVTVYCVYVPVKLCFSFIPSLLAVLMKFDYPACFCFKYFCVVYLKLTERLYLKKETIKVVLRRNVSAIKAITCLSTHSYAIYLQVIDSLKLDDSFFWCWPSLYFGNRYHINLRSRSLRFRDNNIRLMENNSDNNIHVLLKWVF